MNELKVVASRQQKVFEGIFLVKWNRDIINIPISSPLSKQTSKETSLGIKTLEEVDSFMATKETDKKDLTYLFINRLLILKDAQHSLCFNPKVPLLYL